MKGCKKKTAFIRNEDAQWIDDYLINAGQSDNFGMVVRNAVAEEKTTKVNSLQSMN